MMICMILWLIKMFKIIIKRFNLFDWFMVSLFLLFILSIIILLKKPNNLVDEKSKQDFNTYSTFRIADIEILNLTDEDINILKTMNNYSLGDRLLFFINDVKNISENKVIVEANMSVNYYKGMYIFEWFPFKENKEFSIEIKNKNHLTRIINV